MESMRSLQDDADERLQSFFSEDARTLHQGMTELLRDAAGDPEIEEVLIETLESSLAEGNDETTATAWVAIALGELESRNAIGPLIQALVGEDEMVCAAATRALRRIGEAGFRALLEILEGDEVEVESFVAFVRALEGIRQQSRPDLLEQIGDTLMRFLLRASPGPEGARCLETAALSLARLGVARAHDPIERTLRKRFDGVNSYLQEALDILEEHPDGLPRVEQPWEAEFRWALSEELPGGELLPPDDELENARSG